MTFIPLDSIRPKPISESLRSLNGFRLAIDVIGFDEVYKRAYQYTLGDCLIAESDKEDQAVAKAKALCYPKHGGGVDMKVKYKVITLQGTVIHKSGNFTGGVGRANEKINRLRTSKQKAVTEQIMDDKTFTQLKAKRDGLVKELLEVENTGQALRMQDEIKSTQTNVNIASYAIYNILYLLCFLIFFSILFSFFFVVF